VHKIKFLECNERSSGISRLESSLEFRGEEDAI
jgi:hypothetical protein